MTRPALPAWLHPLGGGVHAVDTGFERDRFDAAYLIVEGGRAAYIDTGTVPTLPRVLGALDALGLPRDAVDWVIPTHVHLDHAGAAGALMAVLPRARLVVHPRGARHMIDPQALYAAALAVYGQATMDRAYGRLLPIAADRVDCSDDGSVVELAGRPLRFADTPGHARHHHCIWDEATRGWFCGDTFGLSYREFDTEAGPWILPTSTPSQFDPEALKASVERLLKQQPACMYLTHFGKVGDVPRLGRDLLRLVDGIVEVAQSSRQASDRHQALRQGLFALFDSDLRGHGCRLPQDEVARLLELDVELDAQGLAVWLDRG